MFPASIRASPLLFSSATWSRRVSLCLTTSTYKAVCDRPLKLDTKQIIKHMYRTAATVKNCHYSVVVQQQNYDGPTSFIHVHFTKQRTLPFERGSVVSVWSAISYKCTVSLSRLCYTSLWHHVIRHHVFIHVQSRLGNKARKLLQEVLCWEDGYSTMSLTCKARFL